MHSINFYNFEERKDYKQGRSDSYTCKRIISRTFWKRVVCKYDFIWLPDTKIKWGNRQGKSTGSDGTKDATRIGRKQKGI